MVAIGASFGVVVTWCHCCCQLCFLCGHGCLPPLLLLVMLPSWSWFLGANNVIASYFVVVVKWHHPCCLLFLCGHGCMAPSLQLLFPSWPWPFGTIHVVVYFMVMVA
jgi:hypothetical protein